MIKREVIFGTTNKTKVEQMRGALEPVGIEVKGVDTKLDIVEDGATVEENARKKALAYAKKLGRTVFSMDNGLYFEGLPDDQQPGQEVRRIDGKSWATNEEMLEYYPRLIRSLGSRVKAYWEYGVALARPDGECVSTTFTTPRIFVDTPSVHGMGDYPLESLQIDPESGGYISEMTEAERARFWQATIGDPLGEFLMANL
jgi:XTP/dITP diphosphohydrolase